MTNSLTRKRKQAGELREVLAQNINRLMDQRYKESSNRPLALAKDAGVSLSTVQRIISREAGASIDTVEAFATVFGLPAFQILVPWGLLGEISVRTAGAGQGFRAAEPRRREAPARTRARRRAA